LGGIPPHFDACLGGRCPPQGSSFNRVGGPSVATSTRLACRCVLKWAGGRTRVPGQHSCLPAGLRAAWTDLLSGLGPAVAVRGAPVGRPDRNAPYRWGSGRGGGHSREPGECMSSRTCQQPANIIVGAVGICRPLMHPLGPRLRALRGTRCPLARRGLRSTAVRPPPRVTPLARGIHPPYRSSSPPDRSVRGIGGCRCPCFGSSPLS